VVGEEAGDRERLGVRGEGADLALVGGELHRGETVGGRRVGQALAELLVDDLSEAAGPRMFNAPAIAARMAS
jgi:hypothetical protein